MNMTKEEIFDTVKTITVDELDADEGIETISDVVDFVKKQLDEK